VVARLEVTYAARGRSGLFEKPDANYGEVWYEIGGRRVMSRSTSDPVVLEAVYQAAGRAPPNALDEPVYPGYPLAARPAHAGLVFFVFWPLLVVGAWWVARRPTPRPRLSPAGARP
jgi:hypothetical protein